VTALGFRSNPKSNRELLQKLDLRFAIEALLDSGLWKRGSKGRGVERPTRNFTGLAGCGS
jgi:hypothetical protein